MRALILCLLLAGCASAETNQAIADALSGAGRGSAAQAKTQQRPVYAVDPTQIRPF